MTHKLKLFFSALLVPTDFGAFLLAGVLAYKLRFSELATGVRPIIFELPYKSFFTIVLVISIFSVIWLALQGLYKIQRGSILEEMGRIFSGLTMAGGLILAYIVFQRTLFDSRFILVAWYVLSLIFVLLARGLIRLIQRQLFRHGWGLTNILVFGSSPALAGIIEAYQTHPEWGYKILKHWTTVADESLKDADGRLKKNWPMVLFDPNNFSEGDQIKLQEWLRARHLPIAMPATVGSFLPAHTTVSALSGVPVVFGDATNLQGWGRVWKRLFDLVFSFIVSMILLPFEIILMLLIALDGEGWPIIRLKRIGWHGQEFKLFKFRSMVRNAATMKKNLLAKNERGDGPLFKMEKDPRITFIGRFIRKTSIDELPQFWNVIFGSMSVVGPRPHEPEEVARYQQHHKVVLTIKSGVTGLAQISGRSDLSFEEEVRLDTFYLQHWSLWLDISIILKTIPALFSRRRAS